MPTAPQSVEDYKPAFDKYISLCSVPSIAHHSRYLAPVAFEPEPVNSLADLLNQSISMTSPNPLAPRGIQQAIRLTRESDLRCSLDATIEQCQGSPLSQYLSREYSSVPEERRASFAGAVAIFDLKPESLSVPAINPASTQDSAWKSNYLIQAAGAIQDGARDIAGACWEHKYWALAPILVAVGLTAALLMLGQSTAPMAVYSLF